MLLLEDLKIICETKLFRKFKELSSNHNIVKIRNVVQILAYCRKYRAKVLEDLILNSEFFVEFEKDLSGSGELKLFLNSDDKWIREAIHLVGKMIYLRAKEERHFYMANDITNQEKKFEDFVVERQDFTQMEYPYYMVFAMNLLSSLMHLLATAAVGVKLNSGKNLSWSSVSVFFLIAICFSMLSRCAHFVHRSKFRIQWWQERHKSKSLERLYQNFLSLKSWLTVQSRECSGAHYHYAGAEGDAISLLSSCEDKDPSEWKEVSDRCSLEEAGGSSMAAESLLPLEDSRETRKPSLLIRIHDEAEHYSSSLASSKYTQPSCCLTSGLSDLKSLMYVLGLRISLCWLLLVIAQYMDQGIMRNTSETKLIFAWAPVLVMNSISLVLAIRSFSVYVHRTWVRSRSLTRSRLTRFLTTIILSLTFALSSSFSFNSICLLQSSSLFIGHLMSFQGKWNLILLPCIVPATGLALMFSVCDLFVCALLILSCFSHSLRQFLSHQFRNFRAMNPHFTPRLVFGAVIQIQIMTFSSCLALTLLLAKVCHWCSWVSSWHVITSALVFQVSMVSFNVWMFWLRRHAWNSFYHVWRAN